jgi:hypothetical protein
VVNESESRVLGTIAVAAIWRGRPTVASLARWRLAGPDTPFAVYIRQERKCEWRVRRNETWMEMGFVDSQHRKWTLLLRSFADAADYDDLQGEFRLNPDTLVAIRSKSRTKSVFYE